MIRLPHISRNCPIGANDSDSVRYITPIRWLRLSQARAQSVVNALINKNGVAGSRLVPFGAGPYAPVASNKTEEGRAKNRRVELVEIATR